MWSFDTVSVRCVKHTQKTFSIIPYILKLSYDYSTLYEFPQMYLTIYTQYANTFFFYNKKSCFALYIYYNPQVRLIKAP